MADPVEPPSTISDEASAAMEKYNNTKVSLAGLCAKGTSHYAHKNYEEAADYYAQASEMQAELNGEMSSENAEILFLYGRALFRVGQSKSDVLGGRGGGDKKKTSGAAKKGTKEDQKPKEKSESEKITEEGVAIVAGDNGGAEEGSGAKKPLFQFTGDENFEDSDDDDGDAAEGEEDEQAEEEDDLAAAFEVLDLARVLFAKRLEQPESGESKGKTVEDSPMTTHIKERLADTHDLLAEISLENEKFAGAVTDFRAALIHKQGLYPEESEIIAEAHFKLSLALEFASITSTKEEGDDTAPSAGDEHIDEGMREEAAKELELAIGSTKLKLQNKEVELASSHDPDENEMLRAQIAEVKEIVADMEGRLADLKAPPVDVNAALQGALPSSMGGILGALLGESPAEAAARVEEAKKGATDLTGMVRKKEKTAKPETSPKAKANGAANGSNGKRKADDGEESEVTIKKVRIVERKKSKVEDAGED